MQVLTNSVNLKKLSQFVSVVLIPPGVLIEESSVVSLQLMVNPYYNKITENIWLCKAKTFYCV